MSTETKDQLKVGEIAAAVAGVFIVATSPNIRASGSNAAIGTVACMIGASELAQWSYRLYKRPSDNPLFDTFVWPAAFGCLLGTGFAYLTKSS